THVRTINFSKNIFTECFLVVDYEPTTAMSNVCLSQNITLLTTEAFRMKFLPFHEYAAKRITKPFGSATNPNTGERDGRPYVVVQFASEDIRDCHIDSLLATLQSDRKIVL